MCTEFVYLLGVLSQYLSHVCVWVNTVNRLILFGAVLVWDSRMLSVNVRIGRMKFSVKRKCFSSLLKYLHPVGVCHAYQFLMASTVFAPVKAPTVLHTYFLHPGLLVSLVFWVNFDHKFNWWNINHMSQKLYRGKPLSNTNPIVYLLYYIPHFVVHIDGQSLARNKTGPINLDGGSTNQVQHFYLCSYHLVLLSYWLHKKALVLVSYRFCHVKVLQAWQNCSIDVHATFVWFKVLFIISLLMPNTLYWCIPCVPANP